MIVASLMMMKMTAGYHYVSTSMTWSNANAYCQSQYGTTLATVTSDADITEMLALSGSTSHWIGLNDLDTEGYWVWESGYSCGGDCDTLSWWHSGEPNNSGGNQDCGVLWPSGTFDDGTCTGSLPFMCDESEPIKIEATDNACYSATTFVTDYDFAAPRDGTIVGVELEYVSGGVTCAYGHYALSNWGCDGIDDDYLWINFLRNNADGTETTLYPTSTTDDVSNLNSYTCSNGHGCNVFRHQMSGYDPSSSSLVFMDDSNPISVTKSDTFSLQYSEGCCGSSTSDNSGTACAKVYFYYLTLTGTTASPSTEPTDCDSLHIDAFLTECSAEWDENNDTLAAMSASIADNAADIATVTATAISNAAAIAANAKLTLTATAAEVSTNMTALKAQIEALEIAITKLTVSSAEAQSGNLDVGPSGNTMTDLVGDGLWSGYSLSTQDVVIIGLLVFNVILVIGLITVCAMGRGGRVGKVKYAPVVVAGDSEMEELQK